MSDTVIAIIQGIVEGLTEFLPVSSTGHLILTGEALQFTGPKAHSFEVIIQVGAILAIVVLYAHRFKALFSDSTTWKRLIYWKRVSDPGLTGAAGVGKLALATIPALVLGALLHKTIKDYLFAPLPVAAALFVGGVIILLVDRGHRGESGISADQITSKQAFLIGCIQCLAMWPGMSRSGTVIIGAMLLGLHRRAATEFSFLAAVPVLAAAAAKDAKDAFPTFSSHDLYLLGIGLVTSFLTALLTVKVFTAMVSKMTLTPFGYYRIALAVLVVWITVTS